MEALAGLAGHVRARPVRGRLGRPVDPGHAAQPEPLERQQEEVEKTVELRHCCDFKFAVGRQA